VRGRGKRDYRGVRRTQRYRGAAAPADRERLLRAFAAAVDADRDNLAALEVANAGHPAHGDATGRAGAAGGNTGGRLPGAARARRRGRAPVCRARRGPQDLSGSIWTRDLGRALRVARGVESGNLSVNSHSSVRYSTPFGGFKQSRLGRELGPDALDAFTETKNVFISTAGTNS
jgi:acyl-CoA reductase-like NAD-dependent aldehyde dehydrogenase